MVVRVFGGGGGVKVLIINSITKLKLVIELMMTIIYS
jgi:hypothetical protein